MEVLRVYRIEVLQQFPMRSLGFLKERDSRLVREFLSMEAAQDERLRLMKSGEPGLTYRIIDTMGNEFGPV